jgi:hypothetical protein
MVRSWLIDEAILAQQSIHWSHCRDCPNERFQNQEYIKFLAESEKKNVRNCLNTFFKFLMPLVSTYLCEKVFSYLLLMKNKYRYKLNTEDNL